MIEALKRIVARPQPDTGPGAPIIRADGNRLARLRVDVRKAIAAAFDAPEEATKAPAQPRPEYLTYLCPATDEPPGVMPTGNCLNPLPCRTHNVPNPDAGALLYGHTFARPEARP